jgi:hypothetical protein
MDLHLKSFEFKGHVPRVPEHFSSSSSVLQERIYKELFVEDEDKDRSVVQKFFYYGWISAAILS